MLLKKVVSVSGTLARQLNLSKVEPLMIKSLLEGPNSPLKVEQEFTKTYEVVCQHFGVSHAAFAESLEHYLEENEVTIKVLVDEIEKDYENSLVGKLPEIKVPIPEFLTSDKLLRFLRN